VHRAHHAHATRTASHREAIANRNKARLNLFDPSQRDLEEGIDAAEAGTSGNR
jgi:hypothetical protein